MTVSRPTMDGPRIIALRMYHRAHANMNEPDYRCAVFNSSLDILRL